jgi:HAD superfamily hydrolase (TIGR01509 family)
MRRAGLDIGMAEYQAQFVGIPHNALIIALRAACKARGLIFPEDFEALHHVEVERRFAKELAAVPGLIPLLEAHTGPRAVASSSNPDALVEKLKFTALDHYFAPHIYSTKQAGRGKPAPDVYLMAADRLGLAPEACTVIEDSVNGAKAGIAAGMRVWGFTGAGHGDEGLAARLLEAGVARVFADYASMQAHLAAEGFL